MQACGQEGIASWRVRIPPQRTITRGCEDMRVSSEDHLLSSLTSKAGQLQRACLAMLRKHETDGAIPTNGRFLFYELEQTGHIPKKYFHTNGDEMARTPAQNVSDALTQLRECGLIPWSWITDESRSLITNQHSRSVYEGVLGAARYARIAPWAGQPPPLLLCESRAVAGVLGNLAYEYGVPIAPTGGQCGGFLVNEVAPLLQGNDRRVLYIGDHEIRGPADQIEANTRRYLEKHAAREFSDRTWERLALTQAQADADPRLTDLVIEKKDKRYKPPRIYRAVECEAIGQIELMRLFREKLDALLPEPLAVVRVREQAQRDRMEQLLRGLDEGQED